MPSRRTPFGAMLVSIATLAACAPPPATHATGVTATMPVTVVAGTPTTKPQFSGIVTPVTAADLPSSWRSGCPVGPESLRLLQMGYWGFDGDAHVGTMVVHASVTEAVLSVFRRLFERRFPIRRMEPVDTYGGSDEASTAADNTAGFNCRNAVSSGAPHWSAHAYGTAIDVNPVENPYLLAGAVLPPSGASYVDRSLVRPGMAVPGNDLNASFAAVGWSWGGSWSSPDYQHFSATGG